jgi:hypothetical protein
MEMLGYFNIKRPDVVHETIDGETVIVNLENGVYYSLRYSGVDVWNLIETGANLDELTSLMIDRYDGSADEIKKNLTELLVVLQQEGLVQVSSTKRAVSQEPQPVTKGDKLVFTPPLLEKYSDMQELLLLDPIHEVDEEGWPHKFEEDGAGNIGQG